MIVIGSHFYNELTSTHDFATITLLDFEHPIDDAS